MGVAPHPAVLDWLAGCEVGRRQQPHAPVQPVSNPRQRGELVREIRPRVRQVGVLDFADGDCFKLLDFAKVSAITSTPAVSGTGYMHYKLLNFAKVPTHAELKKGDAYVSPDQLQALFDAFGPVFPFPHTILPPHSPTQPAHKPVFPLPHTILPPHSLTQLAHSPPYNKRARRSDTV
jgi:hypothetical protein